MSDECDAEQAAYDLDFAWIVECERTLEEVMMNLRAAGIDVSGDDRAVVAKWLEFFTERSAFPLECRLAMLRGMLRAERS